jgi:hypothetical protein
MNQGLIALDGKVIVEGVDFTGASCFPGSDVYTRVVQGEMAMAEASHRRLSFAYIWLGVHFSTGPGYLSTNTNRDWSGLRRG